MAKKRSRRKIPPQETVHFRPGEDLGSALNGLAGTWNTSRGDAAKRLVALAIHGLGLDYHESAYELTNYLSSNASFEQACRHIHVRLVEIEQLRAASDQPPLTHSERLESARQILMPYQYLYDSEDEVEKTKKLKIHISHND